MGTNAVLGVDVGTSSAKGVLVSDEGEIIARAERRHSPQRPHPGQVEMDGRRWWHEFVELCRDLLAAAEARVVGVGVSGMGPCTLLTDGSGNVLRPAILYGVDTRATRQIDQLTARYGADEIVARCGSALTNQAIGPKLAWLAEHEPETFSKARRLFMPSSYLVWNLTGEYVLDHHSASQSVPLYDVTRNSWYPPWWGDLAPRIEPPRLCWSDETAGRVTRAAARATGLAAGTPVVAGTIDAWAEAISVDAHHPGDLMLMYGTTMFLVNTQDTPVSAPPLWATVGAYRGSHSLAAGMATSGALTDWLKDLVGARDFPSLLAAADASGPGARGLLMLPYFAGERTPIEDARARGVLAGLTLEHTAGDIYRAAMEATAMGVRHNIEAFQAAGARIERMVAVGGGTRGGLWTQIVSDVTGREQELRRHSVGASYGSAYLAASALGSPVLDEWNPVAGRVRPHPDLRDGYDELYRLYRELYPATVGVVHALAQRQVADSSAPTEQRKAPS